LYWWAKLRMVRCPQLGAPSLGQAVATGPMRRAHWWSECPEAAAAEPLLRCIVAAAAAVEEERATFLLPAAAAASSDRA